MVHLTFENPVYLWYFASIPLLIMTHFLSLRAAKRKAMKFANFETMKRVAGKKFVTRNTTILIMRLIVLTLLIFSVAGLRLWYKTTETENNYVIAIDVSSSMAAKDFEPSRLETAKLYAKKFVDSTNKNARVSVVTFSGVTLIEQVLSKDKVVVKSAIDSIDITKAGGTDIPGALITGTNILLAEPEKSKVIVLFTDGSSTLGNFIENSMQQAIEYVAENEVIVHSIGIGSESSPIGYLPEYYNISAVFDMSALQLISNQTGGIVIPADDEEELDDAYLELLSHADEGLVGARVDRGLLVLGLLMLFIEWGLINSRFRRIT